MQWGTLTLLAGPNGAGKTTLVKSLDALGAYADHKILNADDRTLEKARNAGFQSFSETPEDLLKQFFIEAANEVFEEAKKSLALGETVSLETVLSTSKYRELVGSVLENGGTFELIYVGLRSHLVSKHRVALRVQKGGHDVPADRLEERWKRSLEQLKWFAPRATRFSIYDNTVHPGILLASGDGGRLQWEVSRDQVFPEIYAALKEAFKDSP